MISGILRVLMVTTVLALPAAAYAETLADSVAEALAKHPGITAGKASRDAAKKTVREEKSAYFPVLSANARAGHLSADDDTTRAQAGGRASSLLSEGGVTLTQPIFSGFNTVNRVDAARDRLKASEQELSGNAEDIALTAARAHLNLMRTRELLDLASAYLREIQSRKDSIGLMVKEGAADEAELLQADEILMAAKTTRLGYEEAYRQAEADYMEAVGDYPPASLEFGEAAWDKLVPAKLEDAISSAFAANPRILAADGVVSALGSEADAERGLLLPRMDAELSYLNKDQEEDVGGDLMSAQAMVKMSWNFSTGGAQFARISRGLDQQAEARAKRQETVRAIEHAVRQKYTSLEIVDQQYVLFDERRKANEQILNNFLSQFEGGKQTNLQLIGAHARLFESSAALIDARYRRLLSRFELLNAMGQLRTAFGATQTAASAAVDAKTADIKK